MRSKEGPLDVARQVIDKLVKSFSKEVERKVRLQGNEKGMGRYMNEDTPSRSLAQKERRPQGGREETGFY